jgi:two-component system, OmpR family, response regulator
VKILYAEDDILMQKIIVRAFVRLGYEVTTVDDGQEAIEAIEGEDFNLIILDLFMPKKSGFEVIEFIREELKLVIPILIISRNNLEETIHKAYTEGADDYIVKPFSAEELVVKVTKLLATYR